MDGRYKARVRFGDTRNAVGEKNPRENPAKIRGKIRPESFQNLFGNPPKISAKFAGKSAPNPREKPIGLVTWQELGFTNVGQEIGKDCQCKDALGDRCVVEVMEKVLDLAK